MNVLLTSVGRRVELARAFRAAYERLGLEGQIIATDIDGLAPAFQVVDVPIQVPRVDLPDYIPTIKEICSSEKVDLVLPLIDPDISVLAANKSELESTGARLGVADSNAVEICLPDETFGINERMQQRCRGR